MKDYLLFLENREIKQLIVLKVRTDNDAKAKAFAQEKCSETIVLREIYPLNNEAFQPICGIGVHSHD